MNILRKRFEYNYLNITLILIIVNTAVFLYSSVFSYRLLSILCLNPNDILDGKLWQFFTSMFYHFDFNHLLFNMMFLFFFGSILEKRLGSIEFTIFYFFTGVMANIFSFIVYIFLSQYYILLGGASGALFGVMLLYALMFPDNIIMIWGLIPVKASVLLLVYTGIEIMLLFLTINSYVSHVTHLAGLGFAWIYVVVRYGISPSKILFKKKINRY